MDPNLMEVVDYYQHLDRTDERSPNGPVVAVNGYVYGSRNHPSSFIRSQPPNPNGPQNIKSIIHTMDKAKANQERLRRRKQKYEAFVVEPMMGRPVVETPGIGVKEAKVLHRRRIRRATDLREIYLDLGKTEFMGWLRSMGIEEADARECSQALHDWCANYIKLPR